MSYPLTTKREAQVEWAGLFLFIAVLFWTATTTREFAMNPEVYGPMVATVPATLWSAGLMLTNALHLFGLYINGRWRWSPVLRCFAVSVHAAANVAFLASSLDAPFGDVVTLFSAGFLFWNLRFLTFNGRDLVRAVRGV